MDKIFLDRVKRYNAENAFFDHFIEVRDQLMLIRWYNGNWQYHLYVLEREES